MLCIYTSALCVQVDNFAIIRLTLVGCGKLFCAFPIIMLSNYLDNCLDIGDSFGKVSPSSGLSRPSGRYVYSLSLCL